MATHKTELAAVFEDMDLDMIQQAMDLYGSPSSPPELPSSSSSSSSATCFSTTDASEMQAIQARQSHQELSVYEYADRPYINLLPPELLTLIFAHCIEDDPDSIAALAQVCWSWNGVAASTASFWQNISLSDTAFTCDKLRRKVKLWTTRSGALSIDFNVHIDRSDALLPMLSYLADSSHRWRKGTIGGRKADNLKFGFEQGTGKRSSLKYLTIKLRPTSEYATDLHSPFDLDMEHQDSEPTLFVFPDSDYSLAQVTLCNVYALPPPEYLAPFETITKLSIHNLSDDMEIPMHEVIQVLKAFPALDTLEVGNVISQDPNHPGEGQCRTLKPVLLPNLRYLSIMSICSLRCFLSLITTPALTSLALIHLNTSTIYETELPGEPGDSEDEMHDFSQSPWTDHATGMGLRSLFSRCTPPLRVLIMDYADMRSKDFIWAFRTFRHLEHLRIIASDMSDKVARALEPDPSRNWLPLPRLKILYVNHCQKMNGNAFMRMIDRRLDAAQRGVVRKLEKATVVDCAWFTDVQIQGLSSKMEESWKAAPREQILILGAGEEADIDIGSGLKRDLAVHIGWLPPWP